jgi:hypothetical protein
MRTAGSITCALAAALAGCQAALIAPPDAALQKLLRPVTASPDSVTLEILEARIPLDEDGRADQLWRQVDEQALDPELRRRLLANGLRAGVLRGGVPDELSDLLGLTSEAPKESSERVITPESAVPRRTQRIVQLTRQGQRSIQTTDVLTEASVILSDDGQLRGKTYRQVEGRYELRASSAPGQRVNVRLVPELHHGELKNRYSGGDQGAFLYMPSREREAFDKLTIDVKLAAGEMLVLGCLPEAEASLGGVLHTATVKGRRERELVLVRALESPPSEILADK